MSEPDSKTALDDRVLADFGLAPEHVLAHREKPDGRIGILTRGGARGLRVAAPAEALNLPNGNQSRPRAHRVDLRAEVIAKARAESLFDVLECSDDTIVAVTVGLRRCRRRRTRHHRAEDAGFVLDLDHVVHAEIFARFVRFSDLSVTVSSTVILGTRFSRRRVLTAVVSSETGNPEGSDERCAATRCRPRDLSVGY